MLICECGNERVGKAKFCSECGREFILPTDMLIEETQNTILLDTKGKFESLEKTIMNHLILSDKDSFKREYLDALKSLKDMIEFNISNIDLLTEKIFDHEEKGVAINKVIKTISNQNPQFLDAFQSCTIKSIKHNEETDELICDNNALESYLRGRIKYWNRYKTLDVSKEEKIEGSNKVEAYMKLKEIYEQGLLIEMMLWRYHIEKENFWRDVQKITKETHSNNQSTKINHDKSDLLEIVDMALAFTSPVSAARYLIKKIK